MRPSIVALTLALGATSPAVAQDISLIGVFEWNTQSIAGVSGIEVTEDGGSFTAVSDRGWWLRGHFARDGDRISDVTIDSLTPILGSDSLPVSARRVGDWSDAEGLAIAADGTAWVAFERWAHVWRYDEPDSAGKFIKDHPTFYDHAENWQLEAIAVDPDGVLYAFSEKPLPQGFPIYRLDGERWTIDGYLPEQDLFAIVGADFDTNGDLYLLERKLVVGLWWQNRIRRVRLDGTEDTVLWAGERGEFGNLEGIALWRDATSLRLVLVSDNNGDADDLTQFVEFRLTD